MYEGIVSGSLYEDKKESSFSSMAAGRHRKGDAKSNFCLVEKSISGTQWDPKVNMIRVQSPFFLDTNLQE